MYLEILKARNAITVLHPTKTKLTPECIEIITEAIKAGATDKEAYTAAGIITSAIFTFIVLTFKLFI